MRYLLILLLFTSSIYSQRGSEMMLASYAQGNQGTVESFSVNDVTSADGHDAEEVAGGSMVVTSADIELNYGGSASYVGLLFDNLNIPAGATITNAYIEFHPERTEATSPPSLTIVGEISANPSPFTLTTSDITSRTNTTASVAWNSIGTWTVDVIDANSTSPDFSAVLQEIVDSGTYDSTDNIVIIFEPGGGTSRRRADDWTVTSEAPHIFVDYDVITGPPPVDPIIALNPVAWWDDEDIPGTVDGDPVTAWTDRVASQTLATYVAAPTLELNGGNRAVKFNDTNCLSVAEFAAINFTGQTDDMTYIVQMGNAIGTNGTYLSQAEFGAEPITMQLQTNGPSTGLFGNNLFLTSSGVDGAFGNWSVNGTGTGNASFNPYDILSVAVGNTGTFDASAYLNNTAFTLYQVTSPGVFIGTRNGAEPLRCGCRGDNAGGLGYTYDGSIANILIFDYKLTAGQIATVVANL